MDIRTDGTNGVGRRALPHAVFDPLHRRYLYKFDRSHLHMGSRQVLVSGKDALHRITSSPDTLFVQEATLHPLHSLSIYCGYYQESIGNVSQTVYVNESFIGKPWPFMVI